MREKRFTGKSWNGEKQTGTSFAFPATQPRILSLLHHLIQKAKYFGKREKEIRVRRDVLRVINLCACAYTEKNAQARESVTPRAFVPSYHNARIHPALSNEKIDDLELDFRGVEWGNWTDFHWCGWLVEGRIPNRNFRFSKNWASLRAQFAFSCNWCCI